MALTEDVSAVLGSMEVDPWAIRAILDILDQSAHEVSECRPDPVPGAPFGPSPAGAALANDAAAAHRKVVEAMADLVTGLEGYRRSLEGFVADVDRTDDDVATTMAGLTSAASCVSTPTVATPSACSLPRPGGTEAGS